MLAALLIAAVSTAVNAFSITARVLETQPHRPSRRSDTDDSSEVVTGLSIR